MNAFTHYMNRTIALPDLEDLRTGYHHIKENIFLRNEHSQANWPGSLTLKRGIIETWTVE